MSQIYIHPNESIRKIHSAFVYFFLVGRYSSVPYDHYLPFVFQGEEILQTIRGFTFGYDFYAPSRNVAFHIYATRTNREKRKNVPKFTENEVVFGSEAKRQACEFRNRLLVISNLQELSFSHLTQIMKF